MPGDVPAVLADLAAVFSSARVRWYVFGAQAVIAAGVIRTTLDIDVTVEVPRSGPLALLAELQRHGFEMKPVGDAATFIAETRVIPVLHKARKVSVDVVLAGPGIEDEMLARVRTRRVGRRSIPFIDTADLIALKMLSGRPKDLEDVRSLLRARPPDLAIEVARQRIATLGELVDDSTLAPSFERYVREEAEEPAASPRPRKPRKPRAGSVIRKPGRRR